MFEYVDLGLPSGKKWAKCNLGAKKETEFGKYYQWGDIIGRTTFEIISNKKPCNWKSTPFNCNIKGFNKIYFDSHKNKWFENDTLKSKYDIVYQETNGVAHMPTKSEFAELMNNTTTEWVTIGGVNGRKLTASNGNYIFFPAAGYAGGSSMDDVGSYGLVWSSTLYSSSPTNAWGMGFGSGGQNLYYYYRYYGFSVRGVCDR